MRDLVDFGVVDVRRSRLMLLSGRLAKDKRTCKQAVDRRAREVPRNDLYTEVGQVNYDMGIV